MVKKERYFRNKFGPLNGEGRLRAGWKRRYFILADSDFLYYENAKLRNHKGTIPLLGTLIRFLPSAEARKEVKRENVIKVYHPKREYYLRTETVEEAIDWLYALKRASLCGKAKNAKTWIVDKNKQGCITSIAEAVSDL